MDLRVQADHLAHLMGDRLDIRGDGFEAKLENAGKRLPRHIHAEAERLKQALEFATHPKLSRQVDSKQMKRSVKAIERYLLSVDPWARRRGIVLNWLAGIVFSLLVVGGIVLLVLVKRGLL